jgi:hypothetical protein
MLGSEIEKRRRLELEIQAKMHGAKISKVHRQTVTDIDKLKPFLKVKEEYAS